MIQIRSVDDPFTSHSLYRAAVSALKLAEAMGLLPEPGFSIGSRAPGSAEGSRPN
jgi:hypothetical protein